MADTKTLFTMLGKFGMNPSERAGVTLSKKNMYSSDMDKMVGNWEIEHLTKSQNFITHAYSYLNAARTVCMHMESDEEHLTWPNASVALMLTAHSVELFLKGAILKKNPEAILESHDLEKLKAEYVRNYKGEQFEWDIPFQVDMSLLSDEEEKLVRGDLPPPSIQYRYPAPIVGEDWPGIQGFTLMEFRGMLVGLEDDYQRIESCIELRANDDGACD